MKSCRNCMNSRHDGAWRVDLVCGVTHEKIVQPSMCEAENKANDAYAQRKASQCAMYAPERVVTMRINGITVAVLVELPSLQGKAFDELCTALLLTIANQTGEQVTKEVAE